MKTTLFIALFLIAFGLGAQPAKEYFQKGIDMHKQQDYKAAIHDYNKAIKADADFTEAYYNRGSSFEKLKHLESALESYKKAYELNPEISYLLGIKQQVKLSLCDWSNLEETLNLCALGITSQKQMAH